jgi:hypothetical protein
MLHNQLRNGEAFEEISISLSINKFEHLHSRPITSVQMLLFQLVVDIETQLTVGI